jgi:hypothetical protein
MQTPQNELIQWLEAILKDKKCRAVLRAMLDQYELPVIEVGQSKRLRAGHPPARQ